MGFASKRYAVFRSSDSIKFIVSDWDSNYNRNFRYHKWTTEAVPLPTDNYAVKKYDDTEYNKEAGTRVLYYKNPAFILTFIFVVGVFVLPGIFYLLVKLCLKINICPLYMRRPSSKGTIQPVSYQSQLPRSRVASTNRNPRTSLHLEEGITITEDGWSPRISNSHDCTHNAITQTDLAHCVNSDDWVGITIMGQDSNEINSTPPPSYEEATRTGNVKNNSVQENHHSGDRGATSSTIDCSVNDGNSS